MRNTHSMRSSLLPADAAMLQITGAIDTYDVLTDTHTLDNICQFKVAAKINATHTFVVCICMRAPAHTRAQRTRKSCAACHARSHHARYRSGGLEFAMNVMMRSLLFGRKCGGHARIHLTLIYRLNVVVSVSEVSFGAPC